MDEFRSRWTRSDAFLRSQLADGETVLATGRCDDMTEHASLEDVGSTYTYAIVTDRRVAWCPSGLVELAASLPFEGVQFWTEQSLHNHRYVMSMQHRPLVRTLRVPARRILWFAWGNAIADRPMRVTRLGFSRRDTRAATALRAQLVSRGLTPFSPAGRKR